MNEVLFILGDTPASEFRRRGIARKEENNNKLIINISVVEGPYSEDISNSGRRGAGFFLLNSQDYATVYERDVSSP